MAKDQVALQAQNIAKQVEDHLRGLQKRGPTNPVSIVAVDDNWSVFSLADGTKLRIRPNLANVEHEPGRYSATGDPTYHMHIAFNIVVDAPPTLKRPSVETIQTVKPPKKKAKRKAKK